MVEGVHTHLFPWRPHRSHKPRIACVTLETKGSVLIKVAHSVTPPSSVLLVCEYLQTSVAFMSMSARQTLCVTMAADVSVTQLASSR